MQGQPEGDKPAGGSGAVAVTAESGQRSSANAARPWAHPIGGGSGGGAVGGGGGTAGAARKRRRVRKSREGGGAEEASHAMSGRRRKPWSSMTWEEKKEVEDRESETHLTPPAVLMLGDAALQ